MPFQLVFREILVESLQCLLHLLSLFLNSSRFYRKTFLVIKIKKEAIGLEVINHKILKFG